MKTFLTILLTTIIVAMLAAGGTYYWLSQKCTKEKVALQAQIDAAKTPAKSATNSESADTLRKAGIESSKTVVRGFLDNQIRRKYDFALPYMTASLQKTLTKEEFEGTSSPTQVSRYEIMTGRYLELADLYEVTARVYSSLNGKEESYEDNVYLIVKDGVNFQINEVRHGTDISVQ